MKFLHRFVDSGISLRLLSGSILAFQILTCLSSAEEPLVESKTAGQPATLTPQPPEIPQIHGPKVYGVRPGSVFLYSIPATGRRPIRFEADNLPQGIHLDSSTGMLTGSISKEGRYAVTLRAGNALGKAERSFQIIVGSQIALTPPMGWNSWNCWGDNVSQEKVMAAAKAFANKGLRDHGWTYVNIDDGWQGVRGGKFNAIQPNQKFPDLPGLSKQVHAMGLKLGIYSTPWIGAYSGHIGSSCNNEDGTYDWIKAGDFADYFTYPKKKGPENRKDNYVIGKYSFVVQDAKQWEDWGIDYVKYDWAPCLPSEIIAMFDALRSRQRDMVYSLSNRLYFNYAKEYPKYANCWRISGDIEDTWKSITSIAFSRARWQDKPLGTDKWAPYVGPGHYIDPDMLVLGRVGWGKPHPTRLTADEQYAHISLWCLLSAPLILGCDPDQLDEFTLGLLTNDEVLDVDQDSLAKMAVRVGPEGPLAVYAKPLDDGSMAVGLFNLGESPAPVSASWSELGLIGRQRVRDLWRQKDIGVFEGGFQAAVPPHGVVLIRMIPVAAGQ